MKVAAAAREQHDLRSALLGPFRLPEGARAAVTGCAARPAWVSRAAGLPAQSAAARRAKTPLAGGREEQAQ
jgi:hypothetical protein